MNDVQFDEDGNRVPDMPPVTVDDVIEESKHFDLDRERAKYRSPLAWKVRATLRKRRKGNRTVNCDVVLLMQLQTVVDCVEKVLVSGTDEKSTPQEIDRYVRDLRRAMSAE
jgi:hypothetical protein